MIFDVLSLTFLFYSFYNIYKYSSLISSFTLIFTVLFHGWILYLYNEYFTGLHESLELERSNIFLCSMTKSIKKAESGMTHCEICFDEFEKDDDICELLCDCKEKYYHEQCVSQWFRKKNSCPFCRKEFHF